MHIFTRPKIHWYILAHHRSLPMYLSYCAAQSTHQPSNKQGTAERQRLVPPPPSSYIWNPYVCMHILHTTYSVFFVHIHRVRMISYQFILPRYFYPAIDHPIHIFKLLSSSINSPTVWQIVDSRAPASRTSPPPRTRETRIAYVLRSMYILYSRYSVYFEDVWYLTSLSY